MKTLCVCVCVGVLVGLLGCKEKASGDPPTSGILLVQTVELRAALDKDSKSVGVCERGTVAKHLETDALEAKAWYKIDCGGTIGWFEFMHTNAVQGPLGELERGKGDILKRYSSP